MGTQYNDCHFVVSKIHNNDPTMSSFLVSKTKITIPMKMQIILKRPKCVWKHRTALVKQRKFTFAFRSFVFQSLDSKNLSGCKINSLPKNEIGWINWTQSPHLEELFQKLLYWSNIKDKLYKRRLTSHIWKCFNMFESVPAPVIMIQNT